MSEAPDPQGWDAIANEPAVEDERARCLLIVQREIDEGRARGIPETAGVMVVLARISRAIEG